MRARDTFWAAYAVVYDLAWRTPLTARVARQVADLVPTVDSVVDVGAGTGLISEELRRRGHWVLASDASRRMSLTARGRAAGCVQAYGDRLPLAGGAVGNAVAVNLLHVHPDPAAVVAELGRVVAPGGTVVLVWPTDEVTLSRLALVERRLGGSWGRVLLASLVRFVVGIPGVLLRVRRVREADLSALVAGAAGAAGLELVESDVVLGCQRLLVLRRAA